MTTTVKDLLNRPVQVGDTVLTKGYCDQELTELATVTQVSADWAKVELPTYGWLNNKWTKLATRTMKRAYYQMLVVDEQLQANKHMGIDYDKT